MSPSERLKEIASRYESLPEVLKDAEHNSDMLFLIARVKKLTEGLELIVCIAPTLKRAKKIAHAVLGDDE